MIEGTAEPNPVEPIFHDFNIGSEHKYITSYMEWYGPTGLDEINDLTQRGKDPDLQLYDWQLGEVAASEKFLVDLHSSGCRTLLIGLESVSEQNVRSLNVNHWKAKRFGCYSEYIEKIQRNCIGVYGSFILGFDADTDATIDRTIRFIHENNLLGAQITILTPFPGSRLRERLEKENRILHSDWKSYTVWNAVIRHPHFTPEQLEANLLRIYRSVYNEASNVRRSRHFRKICEKLVS